MEGIRKESWKEEIEDKMQNGMGISKGKDGKVIACMNPFCFVLIVSFVMSILTKFQIIKKEDVFNWRHWHGIQIYEDLCLVDGELPPLLARNGSTKGQITKVSGDPQDFS